MATIKPDELPEFMRVLNRANLKVIARSSLSPFKFIDPVFHTPPILQATEPVTSVPPLGELKV